MLVLCPTLKWPILVVTLWASSRGLHSCPQILQLELMLPLSRTGERCGCQNSLVICAWERGKEGKGKGTRGSSSCPKFLGICIDPAGSASVVNVWSHQDVPFSQQAPGVKTPRFPSSKPEIIFSALPARSNKDPQFLHK